VKIPPEVAAQSVQTRLPCCNLCAQSPQGLEILQGTQVPVNVPLGRYSRVFPWQASLGGLLPLRRSTVNPAQLEEGEEEYSISVHVIIRCV